MSGTSRGARTGSSRRSSRSRPSSRSSWPCSTRRSPANLPWLVPADHDPLARFVCQPCRCPRAHGVVSQTPHSLLIPEDRVLTTTPFQFRSVYLCARTPGGTHTVTRHRRASTPPALPRPGVAPPRESARGPAVRARAHAHLRSAHSGVSRRQSAAAGAATRQARRSARCRRVHLLLHVCKIIHVFSS